MYFNPFSKAGYRTGALGLGARGLYDMYNGGRVGTQSARRTRFRGSSTQTETKDKRRKVTGGSTFKDRVLKLAEAKHFTDGQIVPLVHSIGQTYNVTAQIVQGVSINSRIGDKIYLAALKIKGSYQAPDTSGAYTFRIIVGYSGEEYAQPGFAGGLLGLTNQEIFHNATTNSWASNGIINPKAFSMVYDERFDINSLTEDTAEVRSFSFDVQLKKEFPYAPATGEFGKFKNLYIWVVADRVGAGNSGTLVIAHDLIFKDM